MQTLRSIVYVAWLYGVLLILGVLFLPALFLPRKVVRLGMKWWAIAARWGLKWICGVRTEYRGLGHLPDGPCIIAPKHQCMYDTIAPFEWLKDPAFVLKKELMILPILGWYSWKANMIAIDRGGALKTMKALTKKARQASKDGRQLIIFPEGTRGAPGDPPDYKPGVAAIYKELGLPCVPVALNTGLCWPASGLKRTPGLIIFEVLPPIEPGLDRKTFMARLETNLETATNRLIAEGRNEQTSRTVV